MYIIHTAVGLRGRSAVPIDAPSEELCAKIRTAIVRFVRTKKTKKTSPDQVCRHVQKTLGVRDFYTKEQVWQLLADNVLDLTVNRDIVIFKAA